MAKLCTITIKFRWWFLYIYLPLLTTMLVISKSVNQFADIDDDKLKKITYLGTKIIIKPVGDT